MFLDDEYFPVASRRTKAPRTPRELLAMRLIREDVHYWPEWFAAAGVEVDRPIEGPTFNDASYSIQAAARGEGVALARRSIVGDDLASGRLKRLFAVSLPSPARYWFVSPPALAGAPRVKAFRDWVRAELARG